MSTYKERVAGTTPAADFYNVFVVHVLPSTCENLVV